MKELNTTMLTQSKIREIETKDKTGSLYTTGTRMVLAGDREKAWHREFNGSIRKDANDYRGCGGMAMIDDRVRFGFGAGASKFSNCHIHTGV